MTKNYVLQYTGAEIDNLLSKVENLSAGVSSLSFEIVTELPTENINSSTIYLKGIETENNNDYEEYIYVNNAWEMLGTTNIDLTDYATKEFVDESIANIPETPSFITYITEQVDFVDGVKPEFATGWYVFNGTVTINGTVADATNGGWFEHNLPVYVKNFNDSVYFHLFRYDRQRQYSNISIYIYYDVDEGVWYPKDKPLNAFNITALTTSSGLSKTNTTEYTPTKDYHPATKKYVDDNTAFVAMTELNLVDGVDPATILDVNSTYVFDRLLFNGTGNGWFKNRLVECEKTDTRFTLYAFSPKNVYRYLTIERFYSYADNKWYPENMSSCYVKNAIYADNIGDYAIKNDVIKNFWKGTQAEYDALTTKSDTTFYIIQEG